MPAKGLTATYTLKPYNFHLNPVIDRRLEIVREWTYQSYGMLNIFDTYKYIFICIC